MAHSPKNLLRLLSLLFLAVFITSCGDDSDNNTPGGGSEGDEKGSTTNTVVNLNANSIGSERAVGRMEMPYIDGELSKTSVLLVHRLGDDNYDKDSVNYIVQWDYEKKSQRWTCYQLHYGYTGGSSGRFTGGYPQDPLLKDSYRLDKDYFYGSGFDHGHICPNADRLCSDEARDQTYYLTNMQPQYHKFNGYQGSDEGLWVRMESQLRAWQPDTKYHKSDTLFICKGGTIDSESNIIKRIEGKLIVPKYFFMAVLRKKDSGNGASSYQALGFFAEQKNEWSTNADLRDYVVSIDELEELTGIDFFCNLPDKVESEVEKSVTLSAWSFSE